MTIFAALTAAAHAQQYDSGSPRLAHTMSIVGEGEHWIAPQTAEISGEVVTTGDSLGEARDPHPEVVAAVKNAIEALAADGLVLESARYSIRETFPLQYDSSPDLTEAERRKSVFAATTSFRLSTENLAGLGDLISVLGSGDLRIQSIHFTVSDERLPLLEARKDAARDALEQANAYADALGIDLVEIRSVTDGEASPPSYEAADLGIVLGPDGTPPLAIAIPELLSYRASVTVDWTIGSAAP